MQPSNHRTEARKREADATQQTWNAPVMAPEAGAVEMKTRAPLVRINPDQADPPQNGLPFQLRIVHSDIALPGAAGRGLHSIGRASPAPVAKPAAQG